MKDLTVIIDRFEGEMAVCEKPDRTMLSLPRAGLPPDAREGDVVILGRPARIDRAATAARQRAAEDNLRRTLKRD